MNEQKNTALFENIAFIALGSNQNNPQKQLLTAIESINQNNRIKILKQSSFYATKAYGYTKQDNFINAVVKIATSYTSLELLSVLQDIESQQKRVRTIHWGPRTVDLDILAYNQEQKNTKILTLPHYDLKNRRFVLEPWHEIEPNWKLPDGNCIKKLYETLISSCLDTHQ